MHCALTKDLFVYVVSVNTTYLLLHNTEFSITIKLCLGNRFASNLSLHTNEVNYTLIKSKDEMSRRPVFCHPEIQLFGPVLVSSVSSCSLSAFFRCHKQKHKKYVINKIAKTVTIASVRIA